VLPLGLALLQACGGSSNDSIEANPSPVPTSVPSSPSLEPTPTPAAPSSEPTSEPLPPTADATQPLDCGEPSGAVTQNSLDDAAKSYILCKHNQTRSQLALGEFSGLNSLFPIATNMKRLQWDKKLEAVAQSWASQCQWEHNPNRTEQYNTLSPTDINGLPASEVIPTGENLAYTAATNLSAANFQYVLQGYNAWENEGRAYSYGAFMVTDFCDVDACGHFTQLIWASSYKVACAVSYCPANTITTYPASYFVCNYASAGNYLNQTPYQSGDHLQEVCSTADTKQTACRNGLTESGNYATGL